MMADHGEPCTGSDASYCMNGGKCFKIPSMSMLTCLCNNNYEGSRCEQFQLESTSDNSFNTGMIVAIVILLILILLVLAVIIYYICKVQRKASRNTRAIP
ncbi:pro-neuregulin-4, membrane-bound isoform isoform X1 [Ictalurus punctatus]|uniref:Pro-neuregulin-4, membrane-bound isoform isoform X1 n=1 Tax=Ictalurus punctatus TaxID=7998 RepID=A0A2D0SDP1_ICTPU|nr:pro-neuregulin-4, membrane-bound isoform isoform X1 [Ictalurus punctatus]